MSQSTKKDFGYPRSQEEARTYQLLRFCGGQGGGDCPPVLGYTQYKYPIRVSKFLTYNKSLLLENPEFTGVDIYTDAGASGFCDHSIGTRVPWWLAFSDDGVLTDAEVIGQGLQINGAPPHQIYVQAQKLPQPVLRGGGANPDWENRIWIHIVWENESYVTQSSFLANNIEGVLKVVKHDYDVKV